MLEIKNLSKRFGDQQVLDHINLKIEKGKVFVIIGPSGTGKSTLLRCINALERPEKGTIQLENQIFDYENLIYRRFGPILQWYFRTRTYIAIKRLSAMLRHPLY